MTDKTWDVADPKDLPYRFAHSLFTDEVFVISWGMHGLAVSSVFESRPAFHRYLVEGLKLDNAIADKVIKQSEEILGEKQEGQQGGV